MLLQTASIINAQLTSAPWRTFEYDTCLKTVAPLFDDSNGSNSIIVERQWKEKRESTLLNPDHDINANNTDYDSDDNIKVVTISTFGMGC